MTPIDEATVRNIRKYLRYGIEKNSFAPNAEVGAPSQQALQTASMIRGAERAPAIFVHGIMPRSGTVYVGELLRLHPNLYAFPNNVWEFPFLQQAARLLDVENEFLWSYEQNMDKIGHWDFLPLFGSALVAYLHTATPPGKRMLLKVPSVEHLDLFFHLFPDEHLLTLVRDGRDVVQSTLKTWPELRFSMVCTRWNRAAQMVLACNRIFQSGTTGYWLGRFEDAIADPETFVRSACLCFGLDPTTYPYESVSDIPVRGSSTTTNRDKVTWNPVNRSKAFRPVGRWQHWHARRKRIFKLLAGQSLIDLGYTDSMNW